MQQRSHPTHWTFQQQQSAKTKQYGDAPMRGMRRMKVSVGADVRHRFFLCRFYAESLKKLFLTKK